MKKWIINALFGQVKVKTTGRYCFKLFFALKLLRNRLKLYNELQRVTECPESADLEVDVECLWYSDTKNNLPWAWSSLLSSSMAEAQYP